jgi:hypothetical protein
METGGRPSLGQIIQVDYSASLAFWFPVALWALLAFYKLTGRPPTAQTVKISIAVTIIGVVILAWRYLHYASVSKKAQVTPGTISGIATFLDGGKVKYTYTFQGETFVGSNAVHLTRKSRGLKVGDAVTLIVDRERPGRAFIKDLFL